MIFELLFLELDLFWFYFNFSISIWCYGMAQRSEGL